MLDVDKGRRSALLLGFGHNVEGDGGFTGGFRSVYLNDSSFGKSAYSKGHIK